MNPYFVKIDSAQRNYFNILWTIRVVNGITFLHLGSKPARNTFREGAAETQSLQFKQPISMELSFY